MHPLDPHYAGLDSTDPIIFDQSYDALLFSDLNDANKYLMNKFTEVVNDSFKRRMTIQLLASRGSQDNKMYWSTRYMGTFTLDDATKVLYQALEEDIDPKVRREAIMCLGDLCNNNLKHNEMVALLEEYPKAIIALRYEAFVSEVIEKLKVTSEVDADVDVQLQATSTRKEVMIAARIMKKTDWYIAQ